MSGEAPPAVAVVIPARGRAALLAETLDSLAAQTLAGWEAVVVDDGEDGSERAALQAVVARHARVRLVPRARAPAGAPACRNVGVAETGAPFVLFLDSDDVLAPSALAVRVRLLEADAGLGFVVRAGEMFDVSPGDLGVPWNDLEGGDDLDRFLAADTPWQTSGPLWRRAALARVGPWDEAARSWQDWELHVRALAARLRYAKDATVDYFHRVPRTGAMRSRHDDRDVLVARARTFSAAHRAIARAGLMTEPRSLLLRGLFVRFALKAARLHGDRGAGHALLESAAAVGVLGDGLLALARGFVDAAAAGAGGEDDPAAAAAFPELLVVCRSPARVRARALGPRTAS